MTQRVARVDDGVLEDPDEHAGERRLDGVVLGHERVGDLADGVALVDERTALVVHVDDPARVRPDPRLLEVVVDDGPPAGPPHRLGGHDPVLCEDARDAVERLVDQRALEPVSLAHLDRDGGDAVVGRLPPERSRGSLSGDDDVRRERSREPFHVRVVHVRPDVEHVVTAARRGVEIEHEITGRDEVPVDAVCHPLRARPLLRTRKRPVQVPVEDREVALLGEEAGDVEDGQADDRATEVPVVPLVGDRADHLDPVEFVAVGGRDQPDGRARSLAVDDRHRDPDRIAEIRLADRIADVRGLPGCDGAAAVRERGGVGCHVGACGIHI